MTPSKPQTKAGRTLVEATAEWTGTIEISREFLIDRILAIEREAQGIPPSEALRLLRRLVAVVDAAGMLWTDPVPADSMAAIHDAKEFLAATPSGGIPLIDVELLARAIADSGLFLCRSDTMALVLLHDGVPKIAAEYTRLSESSPAEEGAEDA